MGAKEIAKRWLDKLSREIESPGNRVLKEELIDEIVDLIIQAAVDEVRAELREYRRKGNAIAAQSNSVSLAYNTADEAAYAVNKFIGKDPK